MDFIGKKVEFTTHSGEVRTGIIKEIVFNESLNKETYICVSPYGHTFKLTVDEWERIV